jgi:hypothetical protein
MQLFYLNRKGVLNADTLDLSALATSRKPKVPVAYCSSDTCAKNSKRARGEFVLSGHRVKTLKFCPYCHSPSLFFGQVTVDQAERLEDQLNKKRKITNDTK